MTNALVSIQIIPKTPNGEDVIPYVDAAIAIIDEAGIPYQVSPLETTMEGNLTDLLGIVQKMNERMIELGSLSIISQVKIFYKPDGASMAKLTEKYR
ncbi:thiamine-binding protein [Sporosarcina sp. ANT_H38]|uniref:thiamine-binding protein n=1 Tax=Sporosarcina sp. ANT_H38 TaxID=2597358 RepID=UPI0011F13910|nr:MTH1187 family thiamine-binding protein [Sporosarcina sp. ANT_H38]KAA0966292.1 thiamine-binding protein [Sporosarcina sp. ANT_H38]